MLSAVLVSRSFLPRGTQLAVFGGPRTVTKRGWDLWRTSRLSDLLPIVPYLLRGTNTMVRGDTRSRAFGTGEFTPGKPSASGTSCPQPHYPRGAWDPSSFNPANSDSAPSTHAPCHA